VSKEKEGCQCGQQPPQNHKIYNYYIHKEILKHTNIYNHAAYNCEKACRIVTTRVKLSNQIELNQRGFYIIIQSHTIASLRFLSFLLFL